MGWLWLFAALALLAAVTFLAWAVRGRSAQVFGASVWRGNPEWPRIALTFDDGPSESTLTLLALLDEHDCRATFFQCAAHLNRLPETAREVVRRGHEIGNHSWDHPRLWFRSRAFLDDQMGRAQRQFEELLGVRPRWWRAPFGVRWFGMGGVQRRYGLTGVMWTCIGLDWKLSGPQIADRLLQQAANGAVFCLHDGRGMTVDPNIHPTLEALRIVLPQLRARGFRMVTLSEAIGPMLPPRRVLR
jgi:peptidoglycan-N-acetylglucosamine deacetylase